MKRSERPLTQVPALVLGGLLLLFAIQLLNHHFFKSTLFAEYQRLESPSSVALYRAAAAGSDRLFSYLLLLKVQLHDNQRGRHFSYLHLDYRVLQDWLLKIYELNPASDYPAFLASRVYGAVKDQDKIRLMVETIEILFDRNPHQHWRRMTEACLLAKHRLNDLRLALRLAQKVAQLPRDFAVPFWARDMRIVLLDELNELESARLLISSLLQSDEITDPDERRFLEFRLLKIQQALSKTKHDD